MKEIAQLHTYIPKVHNNIHMHTFIKVHMYECMYVCMYVMYV